jgi:formate hydrogenlyase subunit 6/NADH:ubiquinone oxidoreductase subunit I
MWMALKTALRTIPGIGPKFFSDGYHGKRAELMDSTTQARIGDNHASAGQIYMADRETSPLIQNVARPVTVMYPYERLEDLEPWLFVPGNYNGRIGIVWETCTACKACVRACPNDCLHMESEVRVNVLDTVDKDDEHGGYGSTIEAGGFVARPKVDFEEIDEFDLVINHTDAPQQYDFAEVLDLSGDEITVRWNDSGDTELVPLEGMVPAEQDIVSGRIDLGRCMFCGLCMESCPFNSFFMTNEYDGMSGFTREELWMDASRTRVLPSVHREAVDIELAKRATKAQAKLDRAAKRAASKAGA